MTTDIGLTPRPEFAEPYDDPADEVARRVIIEAASGIRPQRVHWLWDGRLALGTLGILAGKQGLGKSTLAYWLAGQITRGTLPGEFYGTPKAVLVCATEDSWAHTIVPRLIAAGADLDLVYRIAVDTATGFQSELSLPRDLTETGQVAQSVDAALLLLDPLMSRLGSNLDTHKDAEVRLALEPLVALAGRCKLSVLGLMHFNKSGKTDALGLVQAATAFTAVARSVHTVIEDPDDDTNTRRLFGTPKNNLGTEQPTTAFTIESYAVPTDDGQAWTGQLVWQDYSGPNIHEAIRNGSGDSEDRTAVGDAGDWLLDYLSSTGGSAEFADVRKHGQAAGHSLTALKRARHRLKITAESHGFPRTSTWAVASEAKPSEFTHGESEPNELTGPTGPTEGQSVQLVQLVQSDHAPREVGPTDQEGLL